MSKTLLNNNIPPTNLFISSSAFFNQCQYEPLLLHQYLHQLLLQVDHLAFLFVALSRFVRHAVVKVAHIGTALFNVV